jgi:hypothetical protein
MGMCSGCAAGLFQGMGDYSWQYGAVGAWCRAGYPQGFAEEVLTRRASPGGCPLLMNALLSLPPAPCLQIVNTVSAGNAITTVVNDVYPGMWPWYGCKWPPGARFAACPIISHLATLPA